jgi:hypothetical protein
MDTSKQPFGPPSLFGIAFSHLKRTTPQHLFYLFILWFLPSILIMVLHVNAFHQDQLPAEPMRPLEVDYYKKPGCYWVEYVEKPNAFGQVISHYYVREGAERVIGTFVQLEAAHGYIHAWNYHECDLKHNDKADYR